MVVKVPLAFCPSTEIEARATSMQNSPRSTVGVEKMRTGTPLSWKK
jgi:hypothetical protein